MKVKTNMNTFSQPCWSFHHERIQVGQLKEAYTSQEEEKWTFEEAISKSCI